MSVFVFIFKKHGNITEELLLLNLVANTDVDVDAIVKVRVGYILEWCRCNALAVTTLKKVIFVYGDVLASCRIAVCSPILKL